MPLIGSILHPKAVIQVECGTQRDVWRQLEELLEEVAGH